MSCVYQDILNIIQMQILRIYLAFKVAFSAFSQIPSVFSCSYEKASNKIKAPMVFHTVQKQKTQKEQTNKKNNKNRKIETTGHAQCFKPLLCH